MAGCGTGEPRRSKQLEKENRKLEQLVAGLKADQAVTSSRFFPPA
jgi:hypothetical protein